MPNYIKLSKLSNNSSLEMQLSDEEYQQVKNFVKSKGTIGIIPATLIPVRTNNLKNFAKDFFLPTTVNHAIQVQHVVGKIFAILFALVLDGLTFPIRLLTSLPRSIANAKQKEHPLRKYMIDLGVKHLIENDRVRVKLEWEMTNQNQTSQWSKNGLIHFKPGKEQHWKELNVNFIELPSYKGDVFLATGRQTNL